MTNSAQDFFAVAEFEELNLQYNQAYENYKQAVQLDPNNTEYLNKAGLMASTLGKYQEALDFHTKALEIDLDIFGENHPRVTKGRNNLEQAKRQANLSQQFLLKPKNKLLRNHTKNAELN